MSLEPLYSPAGASERLSTAEWNDLCQIMNGYINSQVLATACDFDLFGYLAEHSGATLDDIQKGLNLSAYAARVLMLGCCATGLVKKNENGYFNSPLAEKVLVRGSIHCMIDFVQFNHRVQQPCISHLTEALRECRNVGLKEFASEGTTLYQRLTAYPELEALFQRGMGQYTRLSPALMQIEEFRQVRHLLDVGGGNGSNAIRLCHQNPELKVTIADIPSVIQIAAAGIGKAGFADRIDCVRLDIFQEPWPKGYDAVLLSHVVEIFSPDRVQFLYQTAHRMLPEGGRVFVWTLMANDMETAGLQAAKSSIYFLSTASGEGMAYPGKDHEQWLRECGFRSVRRYDFSTIDHGGLVATK
jgi:hypothetical protein